MVSIWERWRSAWLPKQLPGNPASPNLNTPPRKCMQNFRYIGYAIRCTEAISHLLCNARNYVDQLRGLLLHALFTQGYESLCVHDYNALYGIGIDWFIWKTLAIWGLTFCDGLFWTFFQVKCRTCRITVCEQILHIHCSLALKATTIYSLKTIYWAFSKTSAL